MSNGHAGYTAEIAYTYGYYTELNPLRAQLLLLSWGIQPPRVSTACELGFGQGVTVNIHAAASCTRWYGTDFNPAQTAFAQELAEVSGNGAVLSEQTFQEFCARTDLPDFDFIALHGYLELDIAGKPGAYRRFPGAQAQAGRRAVHQLQHAGGLGGDGADPRPDGAAQPRAERAGAGFPDARGQRAILRQPHDGDQAALPAGQSHCRPAAATDR